MSKLGGVCLVHFFCFFITLNFIRLGYTPEPPNSVSFQIAWDYSQVVGGCVKVTISQVPYPIHSSWNYEHIVYIHIFFIICPCKDCYAMSSSCESSWTISWYIIICPYAWRRVDVLWCFIRLVETVCKHVQIINPFSQCYSIDATCAYTCICLHWWRISIS